MESRTNSKDKTIYHKKVDNKFNKGDVVEVSSDDEGFRGAWYVATVLKPASASRNSSSYPIRKTRALVEYQNLLSDADHSKPLTESIELSYIRPLPPVPDDDQSYETHDVVDAFHRDGWWKGVVSKVFEGTESSEKKYAVVFIDPLEQVEFLSKDLRFHFEWTNETWVKSPPQKRMEGLKFSKGMAVEVNFDKTKFQAAWFPATILEETGFNSFLVKCDHSRNNGKNDHMEETVDSFHIRPPHPKLDIATYEVLQAVDAFVDSSWRDARITRTLIDGRYNVVLKHTNKELELRHSEIRPHLHLENGSWDISIGVQAEEQSTDADSNARDPDMAVNVESSSGSDTLKSIRRKFREKLPIKRSRKKSLEHSTDCVSKSPSKKTKKNLPESEDALPCLAKELNNENSVKPLLFQACHLELTPMQTTNQKLQVSGGVLTKCSTINLVGNPPSSGSDSSSRHVNIQDVGSENEAAGSLQKSERQMDSQATGREDENNENSAEILVDGHHKEDVPVTTSPTNSLENHIENDVNLVAARKFCNGNGEGESENVKRSSLINVSGTTELVESPALPFIKSSSFWENIESLEIFQILPQKPHFGPLQEYKEAIREGFAIGYMATFSNLIEKTSKLRADSSREEIDSYLETVADLKRFGFDVKAPVDRLQKLLSIKDRCEQLKDESKNVHIQMTECKHEKTQLEEEIVTTELLISDLEEVRAMKVSMKVMQEYKLVALRADANVINEGIAKMKHEFESQAAASW
ncbi:DUF724 domain-containing protein 2-like isoform X2 [Mercurialis annua]|uniref:DUF724 domain-containing protein 2-like isoform X2 n=1 Tax=Mercurialis annua TaxID=3986 RepID=UPI00216103CC|nr:DUF724 domain-containing protein 2-like isoform X2 [Mercurialis annua]